MSCLYHPTTYVCLTAAHLAQLHDAMRAQSLDTRDLDLHRALNAARVSDVAALGFWPTANDDDS
jgi:hypothetical protein